MAAAVDLALFDGIPLHPLVVHAPVVLLPLVAGGLVLVLFRPSLRRHLAPLIAVLAIVAAITAILAVWSGDELGEALGRGDELERHETLGELTRAFAVVVAVGATAMAAADRMWDRRPAVTDALGIVTSGLAVTAIGVVALTGHAGAGLAWEGRLLDGEVAGDADDEVEEDAAQAMVDTDDAIATDADAGGAPRSDTDVVSAGGSQPGTVEVVLGEWALVPSVEEVPPGLVTFQFRNRGAVPHALRLRSSDDDGDRLEWRSESIAPGGSSLLVAELPPGTYDLDCPVEDMHGEHDQLGMEVSFTVREGAAPLVGPEGTSAPEQPRPPQVATGNVVRIRTFAYEPSSLRVPRGTAVSWVNDDPSPHTATGDTFDTGRVDVGSTEVVRFDDPGTYDYLCSIHPAMRGRLIVEP